MLLSLLHILLLSCIIFLKCLSINNEIVEILRQKYMKDVHIGFTAEKIQQMSDDDILDMDYFLNE